MPIRNFLNSDQRKRLQQALRESSCPHFRERVLILLLQNDGKTYQEIADFIGCSLRTVATWCVHGDPDNLDSLKDGREKGNHRKVTPEYLQLLSHALAKSPTELGYTFQRWTAQKLAAHLAAQTGITLSSSQIRRILKQGKQ